MIQTILCCWCRTGTITFRVALSFLGIYVVMNPRTELGEAIGVPYTSFMMVAVWGFPEGDTETTHAGLRHAFCSCEFFGDEACGKHHKRTNKAQRQCFIGLGLAGPSLRENYLSNFPRPFRFVRPASQFSWLFRFLNL